MSVTWNQGPDLHLSRPAGLRDWWRVLRRGVPLALVLLTGLLLTLALRVAERPLFGAHRPWTPHITKWVCRSAFYIIGMTHVVSGTPIPHAGALVANHASWLDIFALNAVERLYFVSKSEVAGWPGIGWLARATGTVFIDRDRRQAARQKHIFEERLRVGHRLLFFPEGTSSDGRRVLEFKPTLFAAFFSDPLRDRAVIQPVSVVYRAPSGRDPRFYAWWGDMDFAPHLLHVLAERNPGAVRLTFHPPLAVADFADRKELAQACEMAVRTGVNEALAAQ